MLWLIAQDEESLIYVKEVTVKGKVVEGIAGSSSMDFWSKNLGKYESHERAKEVLMSITMKIEQSSNVTTLFRMPER